MVGFGKEFMSKILLFVLRELLYQIASRKNMQDFIFFDIITKYIKKQRRTFDI